MRMAKPRIIFMGTPEFATASLGSLFMNSYDVVAVVTAPDKPAGRGKKMSRSAIARYALDDCPDLELYQPIKLRDPSFIAKIKELKPDLIIVVAFRMLPKEIWSIPTLGTFNLHASLLPQYRGAAPINHAIINGETITGISTFFINEKIDTGQILFRSKVHISHNDNAGSLHDKLMRDGAKLVIKTVKALVNGTAKPENQDKYIKAGEVLQTAPKIFPDNCYIDWSKSGQEVYNFIRGMAPYPGARTIISNKDKRLTLKIRKCKCAESEIRLNPGEISSDGKNFLHIGTGDCSLEIERLQIEGKKFMSVEELLRGFDISDYKIIIVPQA